MADCLLCDSHEAVIEDLDGQKRVHCPTCQTYTIANELLDDSEFPQLRAELSRAVRCFYYLELWQLTPDIALAKHRIGWFHLFEEDRKDLEPAVIEALVKPSESFSEIEAWTIPIKRVVKVLGVSQAEARQFVEKLVERRIVSLETTAGKGRPIRGYKEFPPVYWWEKCQTPRAEE
jgi:hypothetical protein